MKIGFFFKKLSTIFFTALIGSLFIASNLTVLAEETNQPKSLEDLTINVKDILSLDGENQQFEYFENSEKGPIVSFIENIINFISMIVGSIAVLLFIIAGFMFMTAQGDSGKIDEAKNVIKYAISGLGIIFFSYIIVLFVQAIFTN